MKIESKQGHSIPEIWLRVAFACRNEMLVVLLGTPFIGPKCGMNGCLSLTITTMSSTCTSMSSLTTPPPTLATLPSFHPSTPTGNKLVQDGRGLYFCVKPSTLLKSPVITWPKKVCFYALSLYTLHS